MSIPCIITTCRRPNGEAYLAETVDSIQAAGFSAILMQADSDPRIGIVPHYRVSLYEATQWSNERFIVFQDDILVAKGLHDWLDAQDLPEGVISLYTPSARSGPDGWQEVDFTPTAQDAHPWLHSVGCCALMFTREIAKQLVELPPPIRTDRLGAWIGEYCYSTGTPFWVHNPSLVQHVGVQSARGFAPLNETRKAAWFCEDVRELA